jgi:hypothetical protein
MPSKSTTRKAKQDLREGKSPTTAAGEFVREEIEHVREGTHGARSPQQAIAIGLSKARRAGIPLKPRGKAASRKATTSRRKRKTSSRRAAAVRKALKREPHRTVSRRALSRQARSAARRRRRR